MKKLIFLSFLMILPVFLQAQADPRWMRYPAVSPDGNTIAFTYKGDLYTVPTNGGVATRLTAHVAHDYMPVWSKDGSTIAFASDRYGNFDIYTMPAEGGQATRLTFHSADEHPYTFTNDGAHIWFKAQRMDTKEHRQHPTGRQAELYAVPVTGGRVDQVFTVPAEDVQISADGSTVLYHDNKGYEDPWRKHHKSAIARDIWSYDMKSDTHKKITEFYGEDRNPVFTADGSGFYYLSEESGSFNVHKWDMATGSSTQLTEFELHPVRFLSMGGGTLVFGFHGEIYTMSEGSEPQKVSVKIRAQDVQNADELVTINGGVREMSISPDGKEIAFISRGDVFVTTVDGSLTKQITETPEQESFVEFSPDGEYLLYAAERDATWNIYKATKAREGEPFFYAATLINEEVLVGGELDAYLPKISPDGKKMAYVEDRRTLKVMDLESRNKETVTLLTPEELFHMRDGDKDFSWSPDSKWILMRYDKLLNNADVVLLDASGKEPMRHIVESGYYDVNPKFANEAKQVIWMSNRNGLKSYATSGRTEYDVYSAFLTKESWDAFNLSEEEFKLQEELEKAKKEGEGKSEKEEEDDDKKEDDGAEDVVIEWEGLRDRTARLTIHSSSLGDAVLSKVGGTLYYLSRFEDNYDLWQTDLRTRETKKAISLNARGGSLMWDKNMENLYLLSGGRISKLEPGKGSSKGISISEDMVIDRNAERKAAFEHVWLRTEKIFYEPSFHGIDWDQMRAEYEPLVTHTGNGYEFAELLSEMLGELNVSHAGARYGGGMSGGDETATLGIFYDYRHDGNGILITEVIKGGPLDKAGLNVEAGMIIQKIDGETVTPDMDWAKLLNHKADKYTLLELTGGKGKNGFAVTVKPISRRALSGLLYERYVRTNEAEVLEKSNGRLGYVHIPGMSDGPYRSIFDDMMGRFYDKEAVVVDTRFNGGGDLVADLAMFFTGEPFLTYATEAKVVGGEPTSRYTKPIVGIFNESMYSDGHCYASGFEDLDLGTSVGMPVPGTCSFAGWEGLPGGGRWGVVPVSAKNKAGEWLENNETSPDIIVRNMPGKVDKGVDEQLEKAIEVMLEELE